ncbi:MAG TPA: hypothetical protein VM344_10125 [Vitreimonas sp.]|nr:hypothetical protein [Vitreimonas sp.]
MLPSRRLTGLVLFLAVAGYALGGGGRLALAVLTDSRSVAATVTTAACFSEDDVAPSVTGTVVSKSTPYLPGYIRQGGTYHVYANVTDDGCTPSGVATVRANVGTVTTGETAVSLAPGAFSIGGASYGYRTESITANATLAEGASTYSLTAEDAAGNAGTQSGFSVIVDNTSPAGADVQTTNGGSTVGSPELGDTVTLTFSEVIDPHSVLAGWTGQTTDVVARITNGLTMDVLTIRNAANTVQIPLGSISLGGGGYVSATRDFGATGTASTMVQSGNAITITLGTASGTVGTDLLPDEMVWTPSSTATDSAGNACRTSLTLESGLLDLEF